MFFMQTVLCAIVGYISCDKHRFTSIRMEFILNLSMNSLSVIPRIQLVFAHTLREGIVIGAILLSLAQISGAELAVEVHDTKGGAVTGAIVTIHRTSDGGPVSRTVSHRGVTGADGRFLFTGLIKGSWSACVLTPSYKYLDPCEWSLPQSTVIGTESSSGELDITLQSGRLVTLRVDDHEKVVPTPISKVTDTELRIGAWGRDGQFHNARMISSDQRGHNYEILVPEDADLEFGVSARNIEVMDQAGKAVREQDREPVKVRPSESPKKLHYVVTGRSAKN